jgi:hypothetical protein
MLGTVAGAGGETSSFPRELGLAGYRDRVKGAQFSTDERD